MSPRKEEAIEVFAAHLARMEDGSSETPDELLHKHAHIDAELREMFEGLKLQDRGLSQCRAYVRARDRDTEELLAQIQDSDRYEIRGKIGEGGMGTVYKAEQREPVQRTVAVKVIKLGMDSKEVLQRFKLERRALAAMSHSCIARVFDAGTTERGQPYFVMEYVEGVPLTSWCDQHRLTLKQRIKLFLQVCAGVEHAHQKGIVHRDLKPGNILVTQEGHRAVPKVLDFGLAKATGDEGFAQSLFTPYGAVMGTPEYMAPEQAAGGDRVIDTRADVYSLGVVLYELLSGELPFDSHALRAGGWRGIQRILMDEEPPKPSDRATTLRRASATAVACERAAHTTVLARDLRGDLDWIVMRAMAKDPERRYGAPAELGQDLQRYLDHEPVLAVPPGLGYRIAKFTRKYRLQVFAAAVVAASLLVGLAGTLWFAVEASAQAVRVTAQNRVIEKGAARLATSKAEVERANDDLRSERDRVVAERDRLRSVVAFQKDMFAKLDPDRFGAELRSGAVRSLEQGLASRGASEQEIEAARAKLIAAAAPINFTNLGVAALRGEVLDRARSEIDRRFEEDADTRARLQIAVGHAMAGLGVQAPALELFEQGLATIEREYAADHPLTIDALGALGSQLHRMGRLREAITRFREALTRSRRVFGPLHEATLSSQNNLGTVLCSNGSFGEGRALLEAALAGEVKLHEAGHLRTAAVLNNLAIALAAAGQNAAAIEHYEQVAEIYSRELGEDCLESISCMGHIGTLLCEMGRAGEGQAMLEEALARSRRARGDKHPQTLLCQNNLASYKGGASEEGLRQLRSVLESSRRVLGDRHPRTIATVSNIGSMLIQLGRAEEALPYAQEAAGRSRSVLGDEHPGVHTSMLNLARALHRVGRLEESEQLVDEVIVKTERAFGPGHPLAIAGLAARAGLYADRGHPELALGLSQQALSRARSALGDQHYETLSLSGGVRILLARVGRQDEALRAYHAFAEAMQRAFGAADPRALDAMLELVQFELDNDDAAEAASHFERVQELAAPLSDAHALRAVMLAVRGQLAFKRGAVGEALTAFDQALARLGVAPEDQELTRTLRILGLVHRTARARGMSGRALHAQSRAVDLTQRHFGPSHEVTITAEINLAQILVELGRTDEAITRYRDVLARAERVLGAEHESTALAIGSLGHALEAVGRSEEALPFTKRAYELSRQVFGPNHHQTIVIANNLAALLSGLGRDSEAMPLLEHGLAAARESFGQDDPRTMSAVKNFGHAMVRSKQFDRARECFEDALARRRRVLGEHPHTAESLSDMAFYHYSVGEIDRAITYYREAVELSNKVQGPDHPTTVRFEMNTSKLLVKHKDYAAATELLEDVLQRLRRLAPPGHPIRREAAKFLRHSYLGRHAAEPDAGFDDKAKALESELPNGG